MSHDVAAHLRTFQREPDVLRRAERAAVVEDVAVQQLLDTGHAYCCDLSQEEIEAKNDEAGLKGGYLGWSRDRDVEDGPGVVVRFRAPDDGVTVIDDFAHHPTAIRETLKALGRRFPERRVWAIFEPRSNTTRRNHFQIELAEALRLAKRVVVAEVARLEQVPPEERLNPAQLMADIRAAGVETDYLPTAEEIVAHVVPQAQPGDILCVLSNGGFDNIHQKLIDALEA